MTIKISFQTTTKKIAKIYTAQSTIWPGFWRAWPGQAEVQKLRELNPVNEGHPIAQTILLNLTLTGYLTSQNS
jgi:hypothetical protein